MPFYMPRILYLITELDIGGAEKNLFRLAVALKERGWGVEAACLSGHGEVGQWLEEKGIPVHYVEMSAKLRLGWFVRLVKLIGSVKPDILHTFLFHANVAGRLANLFARAPVVVSSVRVAERRRASHLYMDFLTQALMDREVCVSEGVREFTHERAHISEDKLTVIANPVEPLQATKTRAQMRAELGAKETDTLVLSIGRLDVQKGYEYLVDAAARILAAHDNVLFAVAGEGDRRKGLEDAIARHGIASRFKLLGWRRDIADLYNAADVFALPSLWEGMPNSVLEAATFALPIVATAVEGTREVIEGGRTGILVPPKDSGALWGALERLLGDGKLRSEIGLKAREYVASSHSVEGFVRAHEELYRVLLASKQVGDGPH
jgi:glycosyltransferase involved in cell wall biosynthesis